MAIKFRRWHLTKWNTRNSRPIPLSPGERPQIFWSRNRAFEARDRMNASMMATGMGWRYAVERR